MSKSKRRIRNGIKSRRKKRRRFRAGAKKSPPGYQSRRA